MKSTDRPRHFPVVSVNALLFWKILQGMCWLGGAVLLVTLFYRPQLGVIFFWNILIPVAPALLVLAAGVWRNICPLATTAMLPDRMGLSQSNTLNLSQQQSLQLFGVIILLLIIPLRHIVYNISGEATGMLILFLSLIAVASGYLFERKSAWCSGMCPIHPVERLYGSGVAFSLPNVQCSSCVKCSVPCPDSTKNLTAMSMQSTKSKITELLIVGAFPGYVWGWFQVPDYSGFDSIQHLATAYGYPLLGSAVSLALYVVVTRKSPQLKKLITNLFAAAAVSIYYWYRLPQLLGFSDIHTNGTLIDLTRQMPEWGIRLLNMSTTIFFFWWMAIRKKNRTSWSVRPPYA